MEDEQAVPHRRPGVGRRTHTYAPHRSYNVSVAAGTEPISLYLRLSKYHRDGSDAIERQRIDLTRQLADEGRWTIVGEYVDNDSASSSAARARRGWVALNLAISEGQCRAVAFWKLDRASRVATETITWLARCRDLGVTLVSHEDAAEEINTASAGAKLVTGVKALLAEIETDTMSTRQLAAKAHSAEAGFHHGGTVPFGYQVGPRIVDDLGRSGTRLVPHPVEFPAIQAAIQLVLADGSLTDVARMWQDRFGITTAAGDRMQVGNVRRVLGSPRLMGYRMRRVPEHRRGVTLPLMDYVVRDATGEPILSQEPACDRLTWMRVQRSIASRRSGPKLPWGSYEWLLPPLLRCVCGRPMYGKTRRYPSNPALVTLHYGCTANARLGAGSCSGGVSIEATSTDRFVFGWLVGRLTPDRLAAAQARFAAVDSSPAVGALSRRLAEQRLELEALLDEQGTPRWSGARVAMLAGMVADASDRVDATQAQLDSLLAVDSAPLPAGGDVAEQWEGYTLAQRRRITARTIDRIDVLPGRGAPADRLIITPLV